MNILIVYDSVFGNTEKIALSISKAFEGENVTLLKAADVKPESFNKTDLLIFGSPTRAFRPTKTISALFKKLPKNSLNGIKCAAFDTRMNVKDINSKLFEFLAKKFGYAAENMLKKASKKGGKPISGEGFFVKESKGPIADGETERADIWAKNLLNNTAD